MIADAETKAHVRATGNIYLNSVTGERAMLLVSADDTRGELVRAELWARPHGRVAAPHIHPHQTERFEVNEGRLGVRLGSDTNIARAGDEVEVPLGRSTTGGSTATSMPESSWRSVRQAASRR